MENVNLFETTDQSVLVIRPKTLTMGAFIYRSIADLENLIKFVGSEPKAKIIEGKLVLAYGKNNLQDNRVILSNVYGTVTDVLTFEQAVEKYDVVLEATELPVREAKEKKTRKIK